MKTCEIDNLSIGQLRNLTYPPRPEAFEGYFILDNISDHAPAPIYPTTPSRAGLGTLDLLPLEIQQQVLVYMQLRTLENFRRVNSCGFEVVASLQQYKAIQTHARSALGGALSIGSAAYFTCEQLYNTICMANCEDCGDFGGYIYIITCTRVCYQCFTEKEKYLPLRYSEATKRFGLYHHQLEALPQMSARPDLHLTYKWSPLNDAGGSRDRVQFLDYESTFNMGLGFHGSIPEMEKHGSYLATQFPSGQIFNTAIIEKVVLQRSIVVDRQSGNTRRYMAIVRAPWLNAKSKAIEESIRCSGCRYSFISVVDWPIQAQRQFTFATFKAHLKECEDLEQHLDHANPSDEYWSLVGSCGEHRDKIRDLLDKYTTS